MNAYLAISKVFEWLETILMIQHTVHIEIMRVWCAALILNLGFDWNNGDKQVDLRTCLVFFFPQSIIITIPCSTSFLREAVESVVKTISMNHIYHVTPLAWNGPKRYEKKNNLRFFRLCFELQVPTQVQCNPFMKNATGGETLSSVPCIRLFFQHLSPSIYSTYPLSPPPSL